MKRKKIIDDVILKLKEKDIDLYLIITSEHADKLTLFIPGVDTVGYGAFAFTKNGDKVAFASVIDAQDIEESLLFDKVVKYQDFDADLASFVTSINPKNVALNFSDKHDTCDGLTVGRYNRFIESLPSEISFEIVSSDTFILDVMKNN